MAPDLSFKLTSDMIVIDDRLAGELRLTPEKGMKDAQFYTRRSDIDNINRNINSVDVESSEYATAKKVNASIAK